MNMSIILSRPILKLSTYILILYVIFISQIFLEWKSVGASLTIVVTYLMFRPKSFFHPCNVIAAFYTLNLILPSSINLYFEYSKWEYLLPWGQFVFWNHMSSYSLYQIQFTFLTLYFGCYCLLAKGDDRLDANVARIGVKLDGVNISTFGLALLYSITFTLYLLFIIETGGFLHWLQNYSTTYLLGREGYGWLLTFVITVTNVIVFLLGIKFYQYRTVGGKKRTIILLAVLGIILLSGFAGGFKSRVITLVMFFYVPTLLGVRLSLTKLTKLAFVFFTALYLLTYVRSGGFYGAFGYFIEGLVGYFNTYYLHDLIVQERESGFLTTTGYFINKPLMMLGLVGGNAEYDLSIMLTKEFYPDQWYRDRATQQWPLETDLYLNFGGFYLQTLPLLLYASWISFIYRLAFVEARIAFMLIAVLELLRIMTTLRWVLLPWDMPIWIAQYVFYYFIYRLLTLRYSKINLNFGRLHRRA